MNWYLIIGLLLLTGTVFTILWYMRPRPRCPECGSFEVGQISKEPLNMIHYPHPSGGAGGGWPVVQLIYRVTYRCNECRAQWSKTITETR
jgi:hypothetical protein